MITTRLASIITVAAMLTGCTLQAEGEGNATPTMMEQLAGDHDFSIAVNDDAMLVVNANGNWVSSNGANKALELPVRSGNVSLHSEGSQLSIESLVLDLEDLEVGKSLVTPQGGWLTGLSLSLAKPVVTDGHFDGSWAGAASELDLELSWTLSLPNGDDFALGAQQISGLDFNIEIEIDDSGEPRLELDLSQQGDLLELDDVLRVTSLEAELEAPSM